MPLFAKSAQLIRLNLARIAANLRPHKIEIGKLTAEQLAAINNFRSERNLPPLVATFIFDGRHLFRSRCQEDGYSVDDIIDQLESATQACSVVTIRKARTSMQNPNKRADRYGNMVQDRAVIDCTAHHPRPEVYSVIPIGDANRPSRIKGPPEERPLDKVQAIGLGNEVPSSASIACDGSIQPTQPFVKEYP